jgi:hypothetical protein
MGGGVWGYRMWMLPRDYAGKAQSSRLSEDGCRDLATASGELKQPFVDRMELLVSESRRDAALAGFYTRVE